MVRNKFKEISSPTPGGCRLRFVDRNADGVTPPKSHPRVKQHQTNTVDYPPGWEQTINKKNAGVGTRRSPEKYSVR